MTESVTAKDIAQTAAVSVITVSRVLNNHGNVSEETRQRVLKAAVDLGYFGARGYASLNLRSAEALVTSQPLKEIGFLFFHLGPTPPTDPFWAGIMFGIESEVRRIGSKVSYRAIDDLLASPQTFQEDLLKMGIDGILLLGPREPEVVSLVLQAQLPLVLIDTDVNGLAVDAVYPDYLGGQRQAVEHLLQTGHRRIAYIGPPTTYHSYALELRLLGYRAALLAADLPLDNKLFASGPANIMTTDGYEACRTLLERNVPFTAIVCANDLMAIGAIKRLTEAGLRVPDDVSVIGFDDIEVVQHLTPSLTTVHVNKEDMGIFAVQRLLIRAMDMAAPPVSTMLKVTLVERDSVASPTTTH